MFTSTAIVIASTPYTALPKVFTSIAYSYKFLMMRENNQSFGDGKVKLIVSFTDKTEIR
jgi:hypothetical protein